MRTTRRDGRTTCQVQYLRDGSNTLDVFRAERVRLDTVDRGIEAVQRAAADASIEDLTDDA